MMQLKCQYGLEFMVAAVIHSYLTDVIGQLDLQQQQQQQQQRGGYRGAALLFSEQLRDHVRATIILETQISATISQTNIHG